MRLASFVAAQRTEHGVSHTIACRALELSESWLYKWRDSGPSGCQRCRQRLTATIHEGFHGSDGTYGRRPLPCRPRTRWAS
jgi:hypothetical protein